MNSRGDSQYRGLAKHAYKKKYSTARRVQVTGYNSHVRELTPQELQDWRDRIQHIIDRTHPPPAVLRRAVV